MGDLIGSLRKPAACVLALGLPVGLGGCAHLFYKDPPPAPPKAPAFISLGKIKCNYGRGRFPKTEFALFDLTPLGLFGPIFNYPPLASQTADGTIQITVLDRNWVIPSRSINRNFHIVFDRNLKGEALLAIDLAPARAQTRAGAAYMDTEPRTIDILIKCAGKFCVAKSSPSLSADGGIEVKYVRRLALRPSRARKNFAE